MTLSIAAHCRKAGMFGLAVASSSPAVAARCSHVCETGAVATQNITDPRLGLLGLEALNQGSTADETLAQLLERAGPARAFRQLTIVDHNGETAAFSGVKTLGIHATAQGDGVVTAGNLLRHDGVPAAMIAHFTAASAQLHFGERLIGAMQAGLDAGGEAGPIHSIGLKIVHEQPWPLVDLRVDWHDIDPLAELKRLWAIYAPQMDDYVIRALDPTKAPSFGVPGDT